MWGANMTEGEAVAIFDKLSHVLEELGLGWLLLQVSERIRFGKLSQAEVSVPKSAAEGATAVLPGIGDAPAGRPAGRRATKEKLTRTDDFTARERLELLVGAIEQVSVSLPELEAESLSFMHTVGGFDGITFAPDVESRTAREVTSADIGERSLAVAKMRSLLTELRSAIHAD